MRLAFLSKLCRSSCVGTFALAVAAGVHHSPFAFIAPHWPRSGYSLSGASVRYLRVIVEPSFPHFGSLKTLRPGVDQFPSPVYPSLYFYCYVYVIRAVQNGVHAFHHCLFQPNLRVDGSFCVALDNHLVVAHEHRHGPRTLAPTLLQEGEC
jgi:hypothetical protein